MHKHFHSFVAKDYFELGLQMGKLFADQAHQTLALRKIKSIWVQQKKTALRMLPIAITYFPHYIEELKGYAQGANIDFDDFWTLSLEDDAFAGKNKNNPQCGTMITNNGMLMVHNEDGYQTGMENDICIVKKKIGNYTSLEIFYYNTVGGTAVGVNSHGFAQAINVLMFTRKQIGLPKTLIGRCLMDTKDPDKDIDFLSKVKRTSGYGHNIVSKQGKIWNVEFTTSSARMVRPVTHFAHTNHCLISRKKPIVRDIVGSATRQATLDKLVQPKMSEKAAIDVMNNDSEGAFAGVLNERTIGQMLINFQTMKAKIWLLREKELGWVEYPLDFISK